MPAWARHDRGYATLEPAQPSTASNPGTVLGPSGDDCFRLGKRLTGAEFVAALLVTTFAMPVCAVDAVMPEPQAVTTQTTPVKPSDSSAPEPAAGDHTDTPDSTEQGQVDISNSFGRRPLDEVLRESRRVGVRDTTISAQLRTYYLQRDNFNGSESGAWTLGGSAGLKTGYFLNTVALGVTAFTSQRLYGPEDKDGTKLLQAGQRPYTVLGELYGQLRVTDQITASAGRREFSTPLINAQDSLMTPNTFEAYVLQGAFGSTNTRTLRFGAGYVDRIKQRNSEDFISMATAAGAPAGVSRGVYVAGASYNAGELSIGAVEYYSADVINIFYTEIKYTGPLAERLGVRLAAQYGNQRSTGDDLLTGKSFSADQYGVKAELAIGPMLVTAARTITSSGASMRNSWGSYPGYTSVQVENFYRAGENATMLRAAYNFPKRTGLSLYGLWVHGSSPDDAKQFARTEYDGNVQWTAQSGALQGLALRARFARIVQGGPKDQHENELRLIVNFPLR